MDISETRRRNLRTWIDQDPYSQGNVEAWCAHYSRFGDKPINPTYIRQLVPASGNAARNIGEKAARRLELAGGKSPGWLDQQPDIVEAAVQADPPQQAQQVVDADFMHRCLLVASTWQPADTTPYDRTAIGCRLYDTFHDVGATDDQMRVLLNRFLAFEFKGKK